MWNFAYPPVLWSNVRYVQVAVLVEVPLIVEIGPEEIRVIAYQWTLTSSPISYSLTKAFSWYETWEQRKNFLKVKNILSIDISCPFFGVSYITIVYNCKFILTTYFQVRDQFSRLFQYKFVSILQCNLGKLVFYGKMCSSQVPIKLLLICP